MKKIKFFLKIILPFIIFIILCNLLCNIRISEIICKSQYGECSLIVKEKLNEIKECKYLNCRREIDEKLINVLIVEDFTIQLKLPLKIEVNLVEKKPKFSMTSISEGKSIHIDNEGLILDIRDTSNLPGFYIQEKLLTPGEKVSDRDIFALELVYGISKMQQIEKAILQNRYLSVDLKEGKSILLPLEGDRDFLLGSIALILNELKKSDADTKIGEKEFKVIDLRFKNPVLR